MDFPPILFMATARVEWASIEMEPNDIAPVTNLLTISEAGSTKERSIALLEAASINSSCPRRVQSLTAYKTFFFKYKTK